MDSHFRLAGRTEGGAHVITVSGELDLAVAASLESELSRAVESGAEHIVIDLSQLEFIDSTGLGVLVSAHQRAAEAGCRLGVTNPGTQVARLLQLTGLTERLSLADDA